MFIESKAAIAQLDNRYPDLVLLYPAVHQQKQHPGPRKGKSEPLVLLTVGYGSMIKGFDVTWKIYQALKKEYPLRLVVAGTMGHNYKWYPEITKEAYDGTDFPGILKEMHADPNVQVGPVKRAKLYSDIYPSGDIYLHFCRLETFGYSILEAMSFGLPTIASNMNAIPEMVQQGQTGILVNNTYEEINSAEWFVKSYDEGLAATVKLIEDASLREEMGLNALQRIKEVFNLDLKKKILETEYARVLQDKQQ